jgi:hypothetical protein
MSAMVILPQAALAAVLNKNAEATAPNTFIENLIFIFFSPFFNSIQCAKILYTESRLYQDINGFFSFFSLNKLKHH